LGDLGAEESCSGEAAAGVVGVEGVGAELVDFFAV